MLFLPAYKHVQNSKYFQHCKIAVGHPKNVSNTALESLDIILLEQLFLGAIFLLMVPKNRHMFNYFIPPTAPPVQENFFAYEFSYTRTPVQETALRLRRG